MRKIFFILFILFLSGLVLAQTEEEWNQRYNDNPDSFWNGFISDSGLWTHKEALKIAFKVDPARAASIMDKGLNSKYESLSDIAPDQSNFINELEMGEIINTAIKENPDILNENAFLKKEWFAQNGIYDEGASIDWFDEGFIKTNGSDSTTFNINHKIFSGAKILPSGKIILKDGTEIMGSTSSDIESDELMINKGEIKIGKEMYSNLEGSPFSFLKKEGFKIINGKNIFIKDEAGNILSQITGSLETNGHKIFGKSTKYSSFLDGKEVFNYVFTEKTELQQVNGGCSNSIISCVEELAIDKTSKDIRIIAKDNNKINFNLLDLNKNFKINKVDVDLIKDDSSVVFGSKDAILTFTKNPAKISGNPTSLTTGLSTSFLGSDNKIYAFNINEGKFSLSSNGKPLTFVGSNIDMGNEVIKNVNSLSRDEKTKLLADLNKKWKTRTRDYTFTINDNREKAFINAILKASESASSNRYLVEVTPEEVFTTFTAEGGVTLFIDNYFSEKGRYYTTFPNDLYMSGISDLGLDTLGMPGVLERLQKDGFIPKNLKVEERGYTMMDGFKVKPADFIGLDNGLKAQAGVLAERKYRFINDYKGLFGADPREVLNDDEMFYWSTIYYNSADPKGKLIAQKGKMLVQEDRCETYCYNAYINAARRTAIYEVIKGKFSPGEKSILSLFGY